MLQKTMNKTFFVIYVRDYTSGNYGVNKFRDNGDGTITDLATGLMWMQDDSGYGMEWEDALAYCEELEFAGHTDWRLPSVKELQSIVDYGRQDPAIDPVFSAVLSWYWSSSSDVVDLPGAWRVSFSTGSVVLFSKKLTYYAVRAVRGGRTIQPGE